MQALNDTYEKAKREDDEFGLLNGENKFISWKKFCHSADPDRTHLILVHFSDRILNRKAEEIGMMVHLQNKFQTLPFVLDAK